MARTNNGVNTHTNGHNGTVTGPGVTMKDVMATMKAEEEAPKKRGLKNLKHDPTPKKSAPRVIDIPPLQLGTVIIPIKGTAPLIMNRFGDKDAEALSQNRSSKPIHGATKKLQRVPEKEFIAKLHTLDGKEAKLIKRGAKFYAKGRFGFPASGFKKAMVSAADQVGLKRAQVSKAFHVISHYGNLIEIIGVPEMRFDIVRVGPFKSASPRYRPHFENWSARIEIRFNAAIITPSVLATLIDVAGFGIGVGDWRPEKAGFNGQFSVDLKKKAQAIF